MVTISRPRTYDAEQSDEPNELASIVSRVISRLTTVFNTSYAVGRRAVSVAIGSAAWDPRATSQAAATYHDIWEHAQAQTSDEAMIA